MTGKCETHVNNGIQTGTCNICSSKMTESKKEKKILATGIGFLVCQRQVVKMLNDVLSYEQEKMNVIRVQIKFVFITTTNYSSIY